MPLAIEPRVAWQTVDGQAIVMDLAHGQVLGFNPVGSLIWSLLADHDEPAIAEEVGRRFDVDPKRALEDVRAFVTLLRDKHLIKERA